MKYKISYSQEFNGEILNDSYIKYVQDFSEVIDSITRLETDEHVFGVEWEKIDE